MLRRERPVAFFVMMMLLIMAAIAFGTLGVVDYQSERSRLRNQLQSDVRVLADQLATSLSLPIWNFDEPQLKSIADGVMDDRDVYGVEITMGDAARVNGTMRMRRRRDDQWRMISDDSDDGADVLPANSVSEQRDIFVAGRDGQRATGPIKVGTVEVFMTQRFIEDELWRHLWHEMLIFMASGAVLAASLYFLLWRTVLRPLRLLEQFAGEVSTGAAAQPPASQDRFRGELDRLRASIEKMVHLLAARYDSLQQNQAMLSVVLNSTPQCIFWKDLDSRYLGCNKPFAKAAGLAGPEEIIGKSDFDLPWPRGVSDGYRADDFHVICNGAPKEHFTEPFQAATGEVMTVETTKIPLRDAAGKIYGVLGVFEDITARLANERVIADQLRFEELVARVSSELVLAQPDNLQPILIRALGDIARLLDADRVILGRVDEASGDLVSRASFCPGGPPVPARLPIARHYPELWQRLLQDLTIYIPSLPDLGPESVDRIRFEELGVQSQIAAPVVVDGRLQYVLAAATIGRRAAWSDTVVARIRGLAGLLATTVLRCESEEAVRSSERQFRTFIEQAPVPIVLVPSPDKSPIYFNPAFTRAFGYQREDIARPEDWWPLIYPEPDYRAMRHAVWEAKVAAARETGVFQDAEESEMRTKSGETRYAQVRLTLVGAYRMSFINDLTERRRAETALRLTQYAVDHNPVMIFRLDMEGKFVYANDAACSRFGYAPAEMLNLHIWDIARTASAEQWLARAETLREQGVSLLESVYTTRSGSSFPVEVRMQYVQFSGERHFFVFADDITDRKTAQEAEHAYTRRIQRLATALTRAEERQRRELATILHDEVGQNLFAATTQLLTLRNRVDGSRAEVEMALTLLDKVTRDTRELTFELCPPVLYQLGLMPAIQRLAEQFTARYGIACKVTGQTDGPVDLNTRGLAYQAVRELLNNTAKHAQAKNVTISASQSDGQVTIVVADDGVGFDIAGMRPGSGGFGLFHLRERVELLGGSVALDAAVDRGCRVQLTLPLNVVQLAE